MDAAVMPWLLAQLGKDTDQVDLNTRYLRLGTARAVALEVLRERLADLRANPTAISVSSVVLVNYTANLAAYERQIALLEDGDPPAPDDPPGSGRYAIGYIQLIERRRR
jgi:hypothetical protein